MDHSRRSDRRHFNPVLGLLAVTVALLAPAARESALAFGPAVIKVATEAHEDSPLGRQLRRFKRYIETVSNGKTRVKLFTGGALGDEVYLVRRLEQGRLHAYAGSADALARVAPELGLLGSVYLFTDPGHARRAFKGPLRQVLGPMLESHELKLGMLADLGFRSWYTRRGPLRRPEDLHGLRIWAGSAGVRKELLQALGAIPSPVEGRDVLDALTRGQIDGFDATPTAALASSWYRSARHLTLSRHSYQAGVVVYSARWFRGLPETLQQALTDLPRDIESKAQEETRSMTSLHLKELRSRGVQVHEPDQEERNSFIAATRGPQKTLAGKAGGNAQKILDAVNSARQSR